MTEREPQLHLSSAGRARVRQAIQRAIIQQAQPSANGAPTHDSAPAPTQQLTYRVRYREAAQRASERPRPAEPLKRSLVPVAAEHLGRQRSPARPRPRQSVVAAAAPPVVPDPPVIAPAAPAPRAAKPLPRAVAEALEPHTEPLPELRRPPLPVALTAGALWAIALVWLGFGNLHAATPLATRGAYGVLLLGMGLCTWWPIQWALRLKALTWRGTVGWGLLLWTLAFVPPPTARLVAGLPDLPVYGLLFGSLFLAVSALALPLLYVWGLRRYQQRALRFDTGRSRRQAAEVGIFVALCATLAAMNVLTIVAVILLAAILILSEMVMLSLRGN